MWDKGVRWRIQVGLGGEVEEAGGMRGEAEEAGGMRG